MGRSGSDVDERLAEAEPLAAAELDGSPDPPPLDERAAARAEILDAVSPAGHGDQGSVSALDFAVAQHEIAGAIASDDEALAGDPDDPAGSGAGENAQPHVAAAEC